MFHSFINLIPVKKRKHRHRFILPLKSIAILLFSFVGIALQAQNTGTIDNKSTAALQDKIEEIAESSNAGIDFTELIEDLKFYNEHPLNLNYASDDELHKLGILNPMQIYNLKAYLGNYGKMRSIFELQGIEGFDSQTIQNLLPFVMVSLEEAKVNLRLKNAVKYGHHQILARAQTILQQRKGYLPIDDSSLYSNPNSRYLGSPEKVYFRYGFNYQNRIRFGITMEKDAGEVFFPGNINDSIRKLIPGKLNAGFDFNSAHLIVNNIGHLKALAIGDYQLRFGQGLTLWSGLAFGKSADVINVKKYSSGISPYTSTDENRSFRGAAISIDLHKISLSLFASDKAVDALTYSVDSLANENVASLYETGLHRTPNELLKKDGINLKVLGGNLDYSGKKFHIGITSLYSKFGNVITPTEAPYHYFAFEGKENVNTGLDYSFLVGRVSFFGEASMSRNGGWANLHGITVSLHPRFSLAFIYRNYSPSYQNLFSNPFAESNNSNEKGWYSGFKLDISKHLLLSAYYDLYAYPWLRYGVDGPSRGNDLLLQLDYELNRQVSMQFRIKHKLKQGNQPQNQEYTPVLLNDRKVNLRYQLLYQLLPSLYAKNRVEYLVHNQGARSRGLGYLIYQDLNWRPAKGNTSLSMRYAIFDTDSYDERIYSYENDVLYAFSVPAYYYRGSKVYLMVKYSLTSRVKIWARVSHVWFNNRNSIGSGLDLIDGNRKTEVKAMLQIRL